VLVRGTAARAYRAPAGHATGAHPRHSQARWRALAVTTKDNKRNFEMLITSIKDATSSMNNNEIGKLSRAVKIMIREARNRIGTTKEYHQQHPSGDKTQNQYEEHSINANEDRMESMLD
jgi:hypothetical protein